jgi:hypothetical protein
MKIREQLLQAKWKRNEKSREFAREAQQEGKNKIR